MKTNLFTRAYVRPWYVRTCGGNTSIGTGISQTGADKRVISVSQRQSHDWWGINLTYMFLPLVCAEVRVTYVHGQALASILHLCNSRAHVSNLRVKALRDSRERSQVTREHF